MLARLLRAALACNTVPGGLGRDDPQATADAIEEQAGDVEAEARETIEAAEATADAALDSLNDNGNDSGDDSGNDNANDNEDDNQNDNDNGNAAEDPFDGEGPDNVPVYTDGGELELVLADDTTLSYFIADAAFDDVVDFYREAMPDEGWELAENGDTVFGPLATLVYAQDGRSATVTITNEPIGDRIVVTIFVVE
jgi:hypothetical protein